MNKKYWEECYQNLEPTSFARFCVKYIHPGSPIADLGCGNGRDSYFFSSAGYRTYGIDYAYKPFGYNNAGFWKAPLEYMLSQPCMTFQVYSRFFLHSITKKEIRKLIKWSQNLFMAEFRDAEDMPKLYKDHKRTKVEGEWVKKLLIDNGFEILYYKKGRNMAKYKGEDPLCVRVIARKKDVPA